MQITRHRSVRLGVGFLIAAASAVTGTAASAAAAAPSAHVWITTADGTDKLTDLGTVPFSTASTNVQTVVVDPTQTFQTMTGFGGSITDAAASVLYTLPASQRAQVMVGLFSPRGGDGSACGVAGAVISERTCSSSNSRSAAPDAADISPQTSLSWPRAEAANAA